MNKIKLDSRAELIRNTISTTPVLNASSTNIIMIIFITAIVKSFLKLFIHGWTLKIMYNSSPRSTSSGSTRFKSDPNKSRWKRCAAKDTGLYVCHANNSLEKH